MALNFPVLFPFLFFSFFFFLQVWKIAKNVVTLREWRKREKERKCEREKRHTSFWLAFGIRADSSSFKLTRESPVSYACVSCISSTCFPFPTLFNPLIHRRKKNRITRKETCKTRCSKQQTFRPRTIRSFTGKNCVSIEKEEKIKRKAYGQGHRSIYLKKEKRNSSFEERKSHIKK